MVRVVFRKRAVRDLEELYEYIRDGSGGPVNAHRFIQRIRSFCLGLATFPERGIRRDDIRPGLRILSFERIILIAIEVKSEEVAIGRIFSVRRDYERFLKSPQ